MSTQTPDADSIAADLRMYVMVDKQNLPPLHAGIQALHAAVECTYENRDQVSMENWVKQGKTVVLLGVTQEQMNEMITYFTLYKMYYREFFEPDLDNLRTAVSFQPINSLSGKVLFGKFSLYR